MLIISAENSEEELHVAVGFAQMSCRHANFAKVLIFLWIGFCMGFGWVFKKSMCFFAYVFCLVCFKGFVGFCVVLFHGFFKGFYGLPLFFQRFVWVVQGYSRRFCGLFPAL